MMKAVVNCSGSNLIASRTLNVQLLFLLHGLNLSYDHSFSLVAFNIIDSLSHNTKIC